MSGSADGTLDIEVRDGVIRLGQLLKLSGICDSGAEAKQMLAEGAVTVNGADEDRRGRQLRDGDLVVVSGQRMRVVACS